MLCRMTAVEMRWALGAVQDGSCRDAVALGAVQNGSCRDEVALGAVQDGSCRDEVGTRCCAGWQL